MVGSHPFLDSEHPIGIAHRGGAGPNPENTLPAFRAAVEIGYRYLETDVHLTADSVVVAFHDPQLDRVTDRMGKISDLSWHEVSEAIVGGSARIPRLADLLTAFPAARFNIDAKSDAVVEPLLAVIHELDSDDRVCVASFSHKRMARIRASPDRRFCTSASQLGVASAWLRAHGIPAPRTNADVLQVPVRYGPIRIVTRRYVDRAHRDGLPVHVWTVDDRAEMHHLLDLGVDGLMTDQPEILRDALVERGIWPT